MTLGEPGRNEKMTGRRTRHQAIGRLLRRLIGSETPHRRFDRLFRELRAGDLAIDCGANVGHYTELMARRGAEVYAIEPNPAAFAVLEERFSGYENVHCFHKALHTEPSTVRLYMHEHAVEDPVLWSSGSSLLPFKGNVDPSSFVEVEAIDFCTFVAELGRAIKVVKMDIEGAEVAIIEKLLDTGMIDRICHLLVETHDHKIPELHGPTSRLRGRIAAQNVKQIDLGWH
jgi:FkbM family methyltransferase